MCFLLLNQQKVNMLPPRNIYINIHYRSPPETSGLGHLEDWHDNFYAQGKNHMTDEYNLNSKINSNLKMPEADWIQILRSLKRDIEEFEHESLCKETVEQFNSLLQKAKKDLGRKLKHLEESIQNPNEPEKAQLIRKISELLEYLDKMEM